LEALPVHIELTEMLRCPEPHPAAFLVMSTGEMLGRMVRSGVMGCPVCRREYPIRNGVVEFSGPGPAAPGADAPPLAARGTRAPAVAPHTLQALLDLGGPGGYVVLVGSATRHAVGLAGLMGGIHFVGINPPGDIDELPVLSLLVCDAMIPLRDAMARAAVVGPDRLGTPWLAEAQRIVLRGRRVVVEDAAVAWPAGLTPLAAGQGLSVGERR
jgi:uncharacterized protein YbaR (Trm112 family)